MTLPIKICLIGSEPLYSKEYHLYKRENGKIQMHFRQILQKNNCCNILGNDKKIFCTKKDEYRRKI